MRRVVAGALAGAAAVAGALISSSPAAAGEERVERVLIFALPHVTWEDLDGVDLPNLERFIDRAAVADLSARASPDRRSTRLGDGYVTLGAGTRAVGDAGATDGQGFGVDEPFGIDTAGAVFRRRTGHEVDSGLVQLGVAEIVDRNADVLLDAEPGALGEALDEAGYDRSVIANGDGVEPAGVPPEFRRQAVSGLMDEDGHRARRPGRHRSARAECPRTVRAPARSRSREGGVHRRVGVARGRAGRGVRPRAGGHLPCASPPRSKATRLSAAALRRSDELFGALMEEIDLSRDAVLVVGPTHPEGEAQLTVAALRGPDVEPGLLRTATTRRSGFVQLYDVAPTVLDLVGVDRPSSMAGRPFEVGASGGSTADRIDFLIEANDAARFVADRVAPLALVVVIVHALLLALTLAWVFGYLPAVVVPARLEFAALALLGLVPGVFLARLFPFHDLGVALYWTFLAGAALGFALVYRMIGRRTPIDSLVAATAVIAGLLVIDSLVGSPLQINSALGQLTNRGRAVHRFRQPRLRRARIGRAGRRGADRRPGRRAEREVAGSGHSGDGARRGRRPVLGLRCRWGALARARLPHHRRPAVRMAGAAAYRSARRDRDTCRGRGIRALLDLARPSEQRTHLGRLFEKIGDEGWSGFATVVARKLQANVGNIANTVWALIVVAAVAFFVVLIVWAPDRLRELDRRSPVFRVGAIGAAVLLVLGFALNDSGIRVPGVMLAVFDAVVVALLVRLSAPERRPAAGAERPVKAGAERSRARTSATAQRSDP